MLKILLYHRIILTNNRSQTFAESWSREAGLKPERTIPNQQIPVTTSSNKSDRLTARQEHNERSRTDAKRRVASKMYPRRGWISDETAVSRGRRPSLDPRSIDRLKTVLRLRWNDRRAFVGEARDVLRSPRSRKSSESERGVPANFAPKSRRFAQTARNKFDAVVRGQLKTSAWLFPSESEASLSRVSPISSIFLDYANRRVWRGVGESLRRVELENEWNLVDGEEWFRMSEKRRCSVWSGIFRQVQTNCEFEVRGMSMLTFDLVWSGQTQLVSRKIILKIDDVSTVSLNWINHSERLAVWLLQSGIPTSIYAAQVGASPRKFIKTARTFVKVNSTIVNFDARTIPSPLSLSLSLRIFRLETCNDP